MGFPRQNTGVGCHFPLQGIFPTQGSNPCPLLWQSDSFTPEPPGKPVLGPHSFCPQSLVGAFSLGSIELHTEGTEVERRVLVRLGEGPYVPVIECPV